MTTNRPPSCDLPTKPGPYYWREKDGYEWEITFSNKLRKEIGE